MALRPHPVLVALVAAGSLGLSAVAQRVEPGPDFPPVRDQMAPIGTTPSLPPPAKGEGASGITPPQAALQVLQDTLKELGRKSGFDADYSAVNRLLLTRLADAIEVVENGPRPARQGPRIGPVMTTWRTMNRDFVQQLSRDTAALRSLAEQPIRYRLAEQALYERIVVALRKNVACLRDMAGEWTSQAGVPAPGNGG